MTSKYLDVFYFIKDTQKGTTLRRTDSKGKIYFYAHINNSTCNRFVRISRQEYDQIDQHIKGKKACLTTYFKGSKLYQEHCISFKE
jgi:hypothetical protein